MYSNYCLLNLLDINKLTELNFSLMKIASFVESPQVLQSLSQPFK